MQVLNDSVVNSTFIDLYKQFTVLGSRNEKINAKRRLFFQKRCSLLNEYVIIPNGYCKFLWDGITCYNYSAPYTIVKSKCVSWAMAEFPPSDAFVERRCLNGSWENISSRTLEMLYKNCNVIPFSLENSIEDDSLNMGTRYLALAGYCCSAFALFNALFIFVLLKKLNCGRNWIHFNLFISFFLRFFFCSAEFIHAFWREDPEKICSPFNLFDERFGEKLFILAWNYSIITSYFWVFIEGLYLHNSIYFYVFHESSTIPYVLIGWVTPFLIIVALGTSKALFDNTKYWLAHCDERISWIIRGPLVSISIAELIITANILRQLYSKVQDENYLNERERYRKFAKSFLYLIAGIGGTYFIFDIVLYCITFMDNSYELMVHRAYIVTNSLWVILLLYFFILI
uniref:Secretin receptor n=1 Tax=Panagrolaimus sp. PS1159 TaxID=55785 RepID=A0AC35FYK7_9BILA